MDHDEIAKRVGKLKLSIVEPIIIPAELTTFGQQKMESCLVAKVMSAKAVNRETFRAQMPRILQAKKQVIIEVIGENLFLLDFASLIDRRHALYDGPWTFFKDLVIFKAPLGLQKPNDMVFEEVPIWVQVHNIPIAFMHSKIIRNIAERLGRVLEIDSGEDGRCTGKFARVRVVLDFHKPLKQGIWITPENTTEEVCILLLYERLPNFCFMCGRLGHTLWHCEQKGEEAIEPQFGN
ncbi:uncharacterized protein [Henckelia pumila]|uniref:uncharacterized protein n=1 Tax=Henckelia pumila TaxID=405737 RepID=UPI003C6E00BC